MLRGLCLLASHPAPERNAKGKQNEDDCGKEKIVKIASRMFGELRLDKKLDGVERKQFVNYLLKDKHFLTYLERAKKVSTLWIILTIGITCPHRSEALFQGRGKKDYF